jgi:predicted RNase H-like HicB family nuclease
MRFLVVIEEGPESYGAYVPDLPGCVAVGTTREETLALMQEAIVFHLEDLKARGRPIPAATSSVETVEVAMA